MGFTHCIWVSGTIFKNLPWSSQRKSSDVRTDIGRCSNSIVSLFNQRVALCLISKTLQAKEIEAFSNVGHCSCDLFCSSFFVF